MRLIDGDNLILKIKERCNPYGKPDLNYKTSIKILDIIKNMLECESTTPKIAHWNDDYNYMQERTGYVRCSLCKRASPHETPYCSYCGAEMREFYE